MTEGRFRLVELVGALSLASDLGNDFPLEKGLRTTLLALRLGRALGVTGESLSAAYYVSLLRFIGCSAYAHETARIFPDDNAMRGAMAPVDFRYPREAMRQAATLGRGKLGRAGAVLKMMTKGKAIGEGMMRSDCEVMVRASHKIGLPATVARGLADVYERWDGKGGPRGLKGPAIELSARLFQVAHEAEIHHRLAGREGACRMIRRGRGGWFDPEVADGFLGRGDELLDVLEQPSVWDLVLGEEPAPLRWVGAADLEAVASTFADVTDLKSTFLLGHSSAVAHLAGEAGKILQLPERDLADLRVAGLLHDLGRLSVPTGLWDKPGPLTAAEWERVRLHAYYTERVLGRSPLFARAGEIAALHHERLDGKGYHRAASASSQPLVARVLAAADVYQALTETRPHRPARTPEEAAAELMKMAKASTLDPNAVRAVCQAAGHRIRKRESPWPAGLSDREVEVLRLLARGRSEKEIGRALSISAGTVHTHVAHIYEKVGLSTRAGAALFAMENHLLPA